MTTFGENGFIYVWLDLKEEIVFKLTSSYFVFFFYLYGNYDETTRFRHLYF
jgi:hypothetical protein